MSTLGNVVCVDSCWVFAADPPPTHTRALEKALAELQDRHWQLHGWPCNFNSTLLLVVVNRAQPKLFLVQVLGTKWEEDKPEDEVTALDDGEAAAGSLQQQDDLAQGDLAPTVGDVEVRC